MIHSTEGASLFRVFERVEDGLYRSVAAVIVPESANGYLNKIDDKCRLGFAAQVLAYAVPTSILPAATPDQIAAQMFPVPAEKDAKLAVLSTSKMIYHVAAEEIQRLSLKNFATPDDRAVAINEITRRIQDELERRGVKV